jgi:hypothetical protein
MRSFLSFLVAAALAGCSGTSDTNPDAGHDAAPDGPTPVEAGPPDSGPGDAVAPDAPPTDASDASPDACGIPVPAIAAPTFDPAPGTYGCAGITVKLASATLGTTIVYTTDGTNPTTSSKVYKDPIALDVGATHIRAIALVLGPCGGASQPAVGDYQYSSFPGPSAPTVTPAAGTYHKAFTATVTSVALPTQDEVLCYTLDGSAAACSATCNESVAATCTGSSKTVDASKPVAIDGTVTDPKTGKVTLDSLGCEKGGGTLAGASVEYVLQVDPAAIAPSTTTAIGASGTLAGVQITENGPATDEPYASICWSTDGTTVPDCACKGATAADSAATVGPGLYVSKGHATPVMSVTKAQGAASITVRAVGCAAGYAPSDAPYATATWH